MHEANIRKKIIQILQILHKKNYLAAGDGNCSFLLENNHILLTPRGRNKNFITEDSFAVMSLKGDVKTGNPSSESAMHLKVYEYCAQARAVIHAHPPTVIAYTLCHPQAQNIPLTSLPEVILGLGDLPIAPYARPGTAELAQSLVPFLEKGYRSIILARHGALAWGESLEEALNGIERMEHSASILLKAHLWGGAVALPDEEINWLLQARAHLGPQNR